MERFHNNKKRSPILQPHNCFHNSFQNSESFSLHGVLSLKMQYFWMWEAGELIQFHGEMQALPENAFGLGEHWRPKRVVSRYTKKWAKSRKLGSREKKIPCIPGLILIRSKQHGDCFLFFVLRHCPDFRYLEFPVCSTPCSCYPLTVSIPNLVNKGRALLFESILPWQRW